jgi:hypothetical protein
MLSMGIAMLILGLYVGPRTITPAQHAALLEGTRTAFVAFAALCVLGTLASLARGGRALHESVDPARGAQNASEKSLGVR